MDFKIATVAARAQLEADIRAGIAAATAGYDPRFVLPYLQMHEFEALLFTDPEAFAWVEDGWNEHSRAALKRVRQALPRQKTSTTAQKPRHPNASCRFSKQAPLKTEHGPLIAEMIGIDAMREHCPQFNAWLTQLQAWGKHNAPPATIPQRQGAQR